MRRRREDTTTVIETINGTTVTSIGREQFEGIGPRAVEKPLEFIIRVVNKPTSNQLLYAENDKILVAGKGKPY